MLTCDSRIYHLPPTSPFLTTYYLTFKAWRSLLDGHTNEYSSTGVSFNVSTSSLRDKHWQRERLVSMGKKCRNDLKQAVSGFLQPRCLHKLSAWTLAYDDAPSTSRTLMTASRIKFFSCLLAWHLIFIFWVSEGSSLGFTFTAIRHLKKQVSRGKKGGIGEARHLIICACVQEPNGLSFCLCLLASA